MCFHFMRYFVNSIIFRVSHRLLYCVFIKVDFEKYKITEIFKFLQKKVNLEGKTQHAVITNANTSNGIKISGVARGGAGGAMAPPLIWSVG